MELLLNLCWFLLAIPAVWLWREARSVQRGDAFHSRRCLLLLGCLVVLLFPVISASDDLQAMRPELEESSAQDGMRQSPGHRLAVPADSLMVAMVPGPLAIEGPCWQCLGLIEARNLNGPFAALDRAQSGRAPPFSFPQ